MNTAYFRLPASLVEPALEDIETHPKFCVEVFKNENQESETALVEFTNYNECLVGPIRHKLSLTKQQNNLYMGLLQ